MGLDPETFWRKRPRELTAIMEGAAERLRREHNERAWLAWHIAALTRAKKMPKLDKLLAKQSVRRPRQSWQQQMGIMSMWAARMQRIESSDKAKAR